MYKNKRIFERSIVVLPILLCWIIRRLWKILDKAVHEKEKNHLYYMLCLQWLTNKNNNEKLDQLLLNENIKRIAIYGKGALGELLCEEFSGSDLEVVCYIDQFADSLHKQICQIPVISMNDARSLEPFDAVIVTSCYYFEKIKADWRNLGLSGAIISLEELLYKESICVKNP